MIRSLGSSLLAKSRPGSLSREMQQARITKPEIPGKGAVGTAVRGLTQETEIVPPAPGSEKIIKTAPGIESASLPGIAANQVPLVAGVGLPTLPSISPGAANQPMFQGAGAPASAQGQAGRQATVASTKGAPYGAVATARAAKLAPQGEVLGEQTEAQGGRVPFTSSSLPNIGIFGTRVSAAGGGETKTPSGQWQPTAGQYLAGAVGKALTNIGTKYNAPQIKKGGLGAALQTYGGSQTVAAAGRGSVEKAVQNVSGALRSVAQSVKNTVSNLRSKLFGRR